MNSDQCFCLLLLLAENSFENIPFLLSGNTVWQQISGFQKVSKLTSFWHFLATQIGKVARFARNVECDFLADFQTLCECLKNASAFLVYDPHLVYVSSHLWENCWWCLIARILYSTFHPYEWLLYSRIHRSRDCVASVRMLSPFITHVCSLIWAVKTFCSGGPNNNFLTNFGKLFSMFENYSKFSIWGFEFWHFPSFLLN